MTSGQETEQSILTTAEHAQGFGSKRSRSHGFRTPDAGAASQKSHVDER